MSFLERNTISEINDEPAVAAKIAKESRAKRLALVYFDAEMYKTIEERESPGRCTEDIS